jgi:hypothetical protein
MRHFTNYIRALTAQRLRVYGKNRPSIELYHQHIQWLKEVVPEDRLVFFNVKDGWGPLCKALAKEVPADIPFPRVNDSRRRLIGLRSIMSVADLYGGLGGLRWLVSLPGACLE